MTKPLLNTVRDIVYLLGLNGNTKEYQTKKRLLNTEELAALKQLKKEQAKTTHSINKKSLNRLEEVMVLDNISTSGSSQTITQHFNISDDDDIVLDVRPNDDKHDDSPNNEIHVDPNDDDKHDDESPNDEYNITPKPKKKRLNKKQRQKRRLEQQQQQINNSN